MSSLYNGVFNSETLFGILFVLAGFSIIYDLWLTRPIKGNFRGKIPLIIVASILFVIGLFLFISGIVYSIQVN